MISFSADKEGLNPDFIVETRDSPIIIEVGTQKTTTKQLSPYKQAVRYGVLINANANEAEFDDKAKTLILPLAWFLLLIEKYEQQIKQLFFAQYKVSFSILRGSVCLK